MTHEPRDHRLAGSEAGGLIVEVLIAAVIVFALVAVTFAVIDTGISAHATGSALSDLERDANRVLDRVASELVMSGSSVISPIPSTPTTAVDAVTYQMNTGFTGGLATWGVVRRLELRADPTDPDDGKDNNGNGIVDEKILVLITDPGGPDEEVVTITRWVRELLEGERANGVDDNGNGLIDEPGFCCTLDAGGVWTIRLTLERPTKRGQIVSRTVETSVTPRN